LLDPDFLMYNYSRHYSCQSGIITLSKDQVTAEVIFDFTNRGTVKFAATDIDKATWPKDITNQWC